MTKSGQEVSDNGMSSGGEMSAALDRNIDALMKMRAQDRMALSRQEKIAAGVTDFAGSMSFVYIHLAFFGLWIAVNLGWLPIIPAFDPSMVVLAMVASVEAIFISTFVLISQNRMAAEDDKRADLSLQIALLNEHETTKLVAMITAIADRLEIETDVDDDEIRDLRKDVKPEVVMEQIQRQKPD
jgi:uncharacterized membrane protein